MVTRLNGFTKKTHKTPKKEIDKAVRLMQEYYGEKTKAMETKSWKDIKNIVYGKKGTEHRDEPDRDSGNAQNNVIKKWQNAITNI